MPSTTPGRNLPYPLGTDRLMDGDDQIRKLAQSVENMIQTVSMLMPITAANTQAQATWIFPVPFSGNPFVFAIPLGAVVTAQPVLTVQSVSPTQTVINGLRGTGAGNFNFYAVAIGPITAVS